MYVTITGRCYEMSSLSEIKAEKLISNDQAGVIQHTSKQLLRIYPKASRTDSSNFDPIPFWLSGCQLGSIFNFKKIVFAVSSLYLYKDIIIFQWL